MTFNQYKFFFDRMRSFLVPSAEKQKNRKKLSTNNKKRGKTSQ